MTACVMLSLRDSLCDRLRLKGAFVLSASPSPERINQFSWLVHRVTMSLLTALFCHSIYMSKPHTTIMPWTALARLCRVQDWLHSTGWTLIVIILFADYPCPLFSSRTRPSVYGELGHTIMNLLAVRIYPSSWVKINAVTEPSILLFDSQAKWRSIPPSPPPPPHSPLPYFLRKAWYSYQSGRLWEYKGLFSQDQMPWSVSYACLLFFHFPTLLEV